jgi:hypothetical protein
MFFPSSIIIFYQNFHQGRIAFSPDFLVFAVSHPPPELAWLTENVFPATVMLPFLVFVDVLLDTEYESVADPIPAPDPTVIQESPETAVQAQEEMDAVMVIVPVPPEAVKEALVGVIEKVQSPGGGVAETS